MVAQLKILAPMMIQNKHEFQHEKIWIEAKCSREPCYVLVITCKLWQMLNLTFLAWNSKISPQTMAITKSCLRPKPLLHSQPYNVTLQHPSQLLLQKRKYRSGLQSPYRVFRHTVTRYTSLIQFMFSIMTPTFEWYVVWRGIKNIYQIDMCF